MIYIVTHKQFEAPSLEGYVPLAVGAAAGGNFGYLSDDTGDNISSKNKNFCELTGLYWLWKNCHDDFVGLVHYRRYFGAGKLSASYKKIYSYKKMLSFLEGHDMVVPYVEKFKQNAREELEVSCCTPEIFSKLRGCVERLSPMYLADFDGFFSGNRAVLFNMMFCRKQLFDDYCSWLFGILFELEREVDLSSLDAYMQRLFGFLSERLLNVYIAHNRLDAVNVNVINTQLPFGERLRILRRRVTNDVIFRLRK